MESLKIKSFENYIDKDKSVFIALIVELAQPQLEFINVIVVKQLNLGHHWMVAYFSFGSI